METVEGQKRRFCLSAVIRKVNETVSTSVSQVIDEVNKKEFVTSPVEEEEEKHNKIYLFYWDLANCSN